MPIRVFDNGKKRNFNLQLTVMDFIWWKRKIEELGVKFEEDPISVGCEILDRIAGKSEQQNLSTEERKYIIDILNNRKVKDNV